jgi:hypothetical protein
MHETAESYRRQWATLTGKSERDIYVPDALRPDPPVRPESIREED